MDRIANLYPMSVWMGHKGVVTTCHFDEEHNFFTEVVGSKRVILFPPSAWRALYIYPSFHGHRHMSQVSSLSPEARTIFPRFPSASGIEYILAPGDVLYIPPFWWHYVESLDFSVSIATRSSSKEQTLRTMLQQAPLPVEEEWTPQQKVFTIRSLILAILRAFSSNSTQSVSHFLHDLLMNTRYHQVHHLHEGFSDFPFACSDTAEPSHPAAYFEGFLSPILDALQQAPLGVQEILLGDYLEGLAFWALKPNYERIPLFFARCFATA